MIDHLHTSARRLIAAQTEEEICNTAETAVSRLTDADDSIFACPDTSPLANQGCSPADSFLADSQRLLVDGIVGQAYDTGESWIVDDLTDVRSTSTQAAPRDPAHYRSLLSVPVDDWGVLVSVAHEGGAFSDEDVDHVEQLGSYVAAALDHVSTATEQQDGCHLLEEVASILSHDVRNPLIVAHGQLELARKEHDSDHLEKIATAHDRLEELIEDLVTLARTGERVHVTDTVDTGDVAERAWSTVETRDAELDIAESTTIVADASSLCQVFENLFRNAVVHGGTAVTVRTGCLDEADGFYVEDDGIGVPADRREDVFNYGYSSADERSGFGLNIVQRIVDAHGWAISLTASDEGGTRFEITGVENSHADEEEEVDDISHQDDVPHRPSRS